MLRRTGGFRSGSDSATELRGRHGGTCFDCGRRQGVPRPSMVSHITRRQVLPDEPPPRLTGAAPAPGHNRPSRSVDASGGGCSTLVTLFGTTILGGFDESLGSEGRDPASLVGTSWQ
jgi:hypothetical protein